MPATHTASLADALIGDIPEMPRLNALKVILDCCREPEVWAVLSESDPLSIAELMAEIDAMVRDCETVLARNSDHEGIPDRMRKTRDDQIAALKEQVASLQDAHDA